jgi:hypothetical protein
MRTMVAQDAGVIVAILADPAGIEALASPIVQTDESPH